MKRTRQWTWIATGLSLIALSALPGCLYMPVDSDGRSPRTIDADVATSFAVESSDAGEAELSQLRTADDYVVRRAVMPITTDLDDEHELTIDLLEPRGAAGAGRPLVLVLPIWGGENVVANFFAEHFARAGYVAAIVHRQEKYKDAQSVEEMNGVFKQIVLDHKRALDWLTGRPSVDADRVAVFGVSAGAIKGALVTALDPRVKAAVLGLGGGDIPYILTHSTEKNLRRRRQEMMDEHGATLDEIHNEMRKGFQHDPLKYAQYVDPRKVLLVLAAFDTVVPFKTGWQLRRAMGRPETMVIPTGHHTSVLYIPFIQDVALNFLERRLTNDPRSSDRSATE